MKKIFAIALALVMVLSMASAFASACVTGPFNWSATATAANCGKGKVEVVPFVKVNDGCGNYVWQENNCAAAINSENVYYAVKFIVEPKADMEWWKAATLKVELKGLDGKAVDAGNLYLSPGIKWDEEDDTLVYYLKNDLSTWLKESDWKDMSANNQAAYIFTARVRDAGKAKVCATLKSKLETYAGGIIGNYYVKVTEKDGKLFIGVSSKNTDGTEKDRLVTYTIENEKVTAIKWEAVCGADDYNTIKAYFNLEIGTPVSRDAINKNFGWDNKVESCFQWSKNGAAITNPECKVEIPKTGDASVVAYAVMALVAAAGAMGLKK